MPKKNLLFFPLPLQGHITPILQLADIIHRSSEDSFSITIVHTSFNAPNPLHYPHFTFRPIDDGLSEADTSGLSVFDLAYLINRRCLEPFRVCLNELFSSGFGDYAALISDPALHFTRQVAESFGLKRFVLRTSGVANFRIFTMLSMLLEKGYLPMQVGCGPPWAKILAPPLGSMYAAVLFLGKQNASSVQPVVAVERAVFYRERAAGMYSSLPYAFGQVVVELPSLLIQTVVYGVIVYAMIGFEWTMMKFFWYIFFMYFTLLYFTFYGMMTVAVTPNHNIAAIVASAFYALWNLFSGFIVPKTRIPVWWRWFYYVCPVSWTLYGLVASQFGDIKTAIDGHQTVEEFVRSFFGFRRDFVGCVALITVGTPLLFGFVFGFSIRAFNFQKR